MAGYSGTPLVKKLGIKEGHALKVVNAPDNYWQLLEGLPENVVINKTGLNNIVHLFAKKQTDIDRHLAKLSKAITQDGMIWVSWPKKSSKVATDITEDIIRAMGLAIGLVDVKVCAIDDIWSGLKFVIPVKDRVK